MAADVSKLVEVPLFALLDSSELLMLDRNDLHEYLTRRPSAAFGLVK